MQAFVIWWDGGGTGEGQQHSPAAFSFACVVSTKDSEHRIAMAMHDCVVAGWVETGTGSSQATSQHFARGG